MKKSFVAVLVLLAVVVLISPAIVGRMAEKSMYENLDWAARESGEVRVTTENFARGWFSSEGQHRIELEDGELLIAAEAMLGPMDAGDLPVLVINTKLDHGLIPFSSMAREKGTLAPGLGSAVSTMSIEFPDGREVFEVPGTIFSEVGLTGALHSSYVLDTGSHNDNDTTASWGATRIDVKTNPKSGEAEFDGSIGSFSAQDNTQAVTLGELTFRGQQTPTKYGIAVGDIELAIDELNVVVAGNETGGVKSMSIKALTEIDGSDVNASASVNAALHAVPQFGEMSFVMDFSLEGADAEAMSRVQQALESVGNSQNPMAMFGTAEQDLKRLFASGFEMNFERLDVTLPMGTVSSKMLFEFGEEDPATFDWTTLLLSTQATVDLSIPEAIVEMIVQAQPDAAMAIGGGYLVKRGDNYELNAQLKKGLLTVNGAPIPIPLGAVR